MTESPRRGRPRSATVHDAILKAVRETLIDGGYSDVAMDRVAHRAGVGKQSLYRRWPSKAPLVAEAVMDAYRDSGSFDLPNTGDIREDLRSWLHGHARFLGSHRNAALIRALAAAAAGNPRDGDALYGQLTGPQYEALLTRLQTAVRAGELRDGADVESVAEALIGVTLYRTLTRVSTPAESIVRFDGLIDAIISGVGASPRDS